MSEKDHIPATIENIKRSKAESRPALVKRPRKPRTLTKRVKAAIAAMVFEGMKKKEAADFAGCTVRALDKAAHNPLAITFRKEMERARDAELNLRSVKVAADLMDRSESEHVRLQAAQWLYERTDPNAILRGSETSKTLIININPANDAPSQLIRDQRAGTVRLLDNQELTDVPSED